MSDLNVALENLKSERKTLFMLARNAADNAELAVLAKSGYLHEISEFGWASLARVYSYSVARLDRTIEFAELPKEQK